MEQKNDEIKEELQVYDGKQLDYDLESPTGPIRNLMTTKQFRKYLFRFLLISSLLAIVLPYIPPLNLTFLKTPYYIIPLSMFASFISFQVIPLLTTYIHKKELQLKDLIDEEIGTQNMKKIPSNPDLKLLENPIHQIKLYKYLLYTFSSIFMGILVYYLLFDLEHTTLNYIEITGILITYVNFFNNIHQNVSRVVLTILHYYKNRHIVKEINYNSNLQNEINLDMNVINQSIHN